jgi:hypothetical protein
MVTANFFWHGPRLRLYERACLTSFVQKGLSVNLYTFNDKLDVPEGVRRIDARKVAKEDEVTSLTQGGKRGSIAAFTDLFRYRLFQREPGWWFDTDVFCLSEVDAFKQIEQSSAGLLVGEEAPGKLNGAVLCVTDPSVALELEKRANAVGTVFPWGAIGPGLISRYVDDLPTKCTVVSPDTFYPIHYQEADKLFRTEQRSECEMRTSRALSVHLWNEILTTWKIPVEVLPCEGSYLSHLFGTTGVKVAQDTSLPQATLEDLQYFGRIGPKGRRYINILTEVQSLKRKIFDRHS